MTQSARLLRHFFPLPLIGNALLGSSSLLGCMEMREGPTKEEESAAGCANCHGDPTRDSDLLQRAAPPTNLNGSSGVGYPGVGAHQLHLQGGETYGPVACTECHRVPRTTLEEGHIDDALPADIDFGPLTKTGGLDPEYDPATRNCSNTWCHGSSKAIWTDPRSSENACGSCHGLPPASPHPQSTRCADCHGEVISADGEIIEPSLHVDGTVQVVDGGCTTCHGGDGPAPPVDLNGNDSPEAPGVGAHQAHLSGGRFSRAVACSECHIVPEQTGDDGHVDDDDQEAELVFSGVALERERDPSYDFGETTCSDVYCHGPGEPAAVSPEWTANESLGCTSCHQMPPAEPHPQMAQCSTCHENWTPGLEVVDRDLHVNGIVEVDTPMACNGCHGSDNPAPPTDLNGRSDTSLASVGAHQTHVLGTELSRAVPCEECHTVPSSLFEPGHIDTVVDLVFAGIATTNDTQPIYEGGTCSESYCHGAAFPPTLPSGGSLTEPDWTVVDGSQTECGSCHGLPPPSHGSLTDCASCHENTRPDNRSFFDPSLHVNGVTETYLPD